MDPEKKNKHMTLEDRIEIQECLSKGMTFKAIAARISKDPTTVSKEVKLHSRTYTNSFVKTDECCPKLLRAPFVCNGCDKCRYASCKYTRRKYIAKEAQKEYELVLSESREGIPLNKEEFYETEKTISNAVKAGQHIYHAIHANELPVSKSTVYRHITKGYYSISPLDLPRALKFKPRKAKACEYVPKGVKIGRSYEDFTHLLEENPLIPYIEMDTVIGRIGGKVIMTFQFVNVDFMFGILLDNKTAAEAGAKITALKHKLKKAGMSFGEVFPLLLTDNGGEFSNVFAFENDLEGNKETSLFFCDPNASYQKPHVENNHILFRDIVPGGSSYDDFSQDTVNLIFSHVNAVKRKQFNGKSAFDMFTFTYSAQLASVLGISAVDPTKVIQSPKLLKSILK
jgi:IS30 family transposase